MLSGCSLQSMAAGYFQTTLTNAEENFQKSQNYYVVERALPAFIVLLDATIAQNPEDPALLLQGAKLHTVYGISFAEPVNTEWAKLHYQQASQYLEKLWQIKYRLSPASTAFQELKQLVAAFTIDNIADLFWLAMSWGNYINTSRDETAAISKISYIEMLMQRVLELDESYENAMPHLFLGAFYSASQTTGEKQKAQQHFERAIQLTKQEMLVVHVTYARTFACTYKDQKLFETLLNYVVERWENRAAKPFAAQYTLSNAMAHQQAKALMENSDQLFPSFESEEPQPANNQGAGKE